jgi:poly-gamma-glutamate capsule biosynthesis protein CapA/YwtB (metallophosphatase superfamily)
MLPDHLSRLIAETTGHSPTGLRRAHRDTPLEPVTEMVLAAASTLSGVETQLETQIDLAQRALTTAAQALAAGRQTNSLGILQNTGLHVDLLAGRREQAADALAAALRAYTEATVAAARPAGNTPAEPSEDR